jgi:hypothetical protein
MQTCILHISLQNKFHFGKCPASYVQNTGRNAFKSSCEVFVNWEWKALTSRRLSGLQSQSERYPCPELNLDSSVVQPVA